MNHPLFCAWDPVDHPLLPCSSTCAFKGLRSIPTQIRISDSTQQAISPLDHDRSLTKPQTKISVDPSWTSRNPGEMPAQSTWIFMDCRSMHCAWTVWENCVDHTARARLDLDCAPLMPAHPCTGPHAAIRARTTVAEVGNASMHWAACCHMQIGRAHV